MPSNTKKIINDFEKLNLGSIKKQYDSAELYWISSTVNENEARRTFAYAHEEQLEKLAKYRNSLPDNDRDFLDQHLSKEGYIGMLNDYLWMKDDRALHQKHNPTFHNRASVHNVAKQTATRKKDRVKHIIGEKAKTTNFRTTYVQPPVLDDPTLTDAQRKGLKDFHGWLYRNCEKSKGNILFGGQGGARAFAEEFMKKPASVQLKALYLLETKNWKQENHSYFDFESQTSYVPNLDKLRNRMNNNSFKIWKHASGSYIRWHRLEKSLEMAVESKDKLEAFREKQGNLLHKINNNPSASARQKETAQYHALFESNAAVDLIDSNVKKNKTTPIDKKALEDKISAFKKGSATEAELQNELTKLKADAKPDLEAISKSGWESWQEVNDNADYTLGLTSTAEDTLETIANSAQGFKGVIAEDHLHYAAAIAKHRNANQQSIDKVSLGCDYATSALTALTGLTGAVGSAFSIAEAAQKHGITTTSDRLGTAVDLTAQVGSTLNSLTTAGFKVAEFLKGNTAVIETAGKVLPWVNVGVGGVGVVGSGVGLFANSRRNDNFNKARALSPGNDPRLEQLAQLGSKLNKLDAKKNWGNLLSNTISTGTGVAAIVASGATVVSPLLCGGGLLFGLGKTVYDAQSIEREKYRTVIDSEVLGGKLSTANKNLETKLDENLKRYKPGSKQFKKLTKLKTNKAERQDRIRKDAAAKDGSVRMIDSYKKHMRKIGKEIFAEVYYVDPKKKDNPDYITNANYKNYYEGTQKQQNTAEYRKRLSYQELLKGFKMRKQKFTKLNTAAATKELEEKTLDNM